MSDDPTAADGEITVNIRCPNGSKFAVKIGLKSTVGSFKSVISQSCDILPEQQRLIYKGRILKDEQTLDSYGLDADHTVHLVRGFVPDASAQNTGAANTVTPNPTPSGMGVASEDVSFGGSGLGASLFPGLGLNGLGGSSGLFDAGLPQFEQMQQQLTQNPSLMSEMMNSPLFQNLLSNPDIIRNMITSNPQMREIVDQNPELAHVLNDPNTLRQTLETARNPELMREMMRNTDRAMSNIESSPEGFNMLRRMYENVQEPFLNATTMAGDTRNDLGSNPFAALLGTQGGGQVRDPTDPTSTNSESATGAPVPNSNPLPNPWASGGTGSAQANASTRSNPPGLSGLEGMLGSMPDIASVDQLMQNPAMSQVMQSVLSNPEYMNQILGLNPQMRGLMDSVPQLREMMGNPDFIRQLTSPETMQQLLTVQQSLSQAGRQSSTQEAGPNGGGTGGLDYTGLDMLMGMFGGLGSGNPINANQSNVPPEELYAAQLSQLQEMGFFDMRENINALIATAGNVHAAVERLLGNPGR